MTTHSSLRAAIQLVVLVVALLGALGAAAAAAGAGAQPTDAGTAAQQPELMLFEEPTVGAAAKRDQPAHAAPASVTVITAEQIRRFGYRTLAEALRTVRGFYGSYDRNYSYIGVRGFLRSGDYNDRILLLVNGHTYNDDIYQSALLGTEFGIDLEIVDRIEVIPGPGAALYGGNALFAVINVVTKDGASLPGARPLAETGTYFRKRGQMSVGHVFENGLDVLIDGSAFQVDGAPRLFFPAYDTPETNNGIAVNLDGDQAINFFVSAKYGGFFFQGGYNDRTKQIPTGAFGTVFNAKGTQTVDGRQFAELSYTGEIAPDLTGTARLYYDGVRYHGTYIYGSGEDRVKNQDLATSNWLGSEFRGRWEGLERNIVTLGAEYTYHPDALQENFDLPTHVEFLDNRQVYSTVGVFLQDEVTLPWNLTLTAGARYDHYYLDLEQASPRIALVWEPRSTTHVKLIYGSAFRPPNLYELYYDVGDGSFEQLGNLDLRPEVITIYEAALEQELWGLARATFAIYHYQIRDLIDQVQVDTPDGTALQFQNVGTARANGGELELRVPLPKGVALRTSYSLQEARAANGELLDNCPKHLGYLGLLAPSIYGVAAAAELQIVGPRKTLARNTVATVTLLNLNLDYATPIPKLGFTLGLYNILNQHYSDPVGPDLIEDSIKQDGFAFRVQTTYVFD